MASKMQGRWWVVSIALDEHRVRYPWWWGRYCLVLGAYRAHPTEKRLRLNVRRMGRWGACAGWGRWWLMADVREPWVA